MQASSGKMTVTKSNTDALGIDRKTRQDIRAKIENFPHFNDDNTKKLLLAFFNAAYESESGIKLQFKSAHRYQKNNASRNFVNRFPILADAIDLARGDEMGIMESLKDNFSFGYTATNEYEYVFVLPVVDIFGSVRDNTTLDTFKKALLQAKSVKHKKNYDQSISFDETKPGLDEWALDVA